ncbi:1805_t:CDS:2, partial [Scutellospora calospora]
GGDLALIQSFINSIGESLFALKNVNSLYITSDVQQTFENKLPGPFPLPLVSYLYCFVFTEFRQTLLKLQERYSGIFELYVGVNRKIIVGDPGLLDVIYDKSSDSIFQKCIIPGAVSLGMEDIGINLKNYMTSINDVIEEMFDENDQRKNFELDLNIWILEIFAKDDVDIVTLQFPTALDTQDMRVF